MNKRVFLPEHRRSPQTRLTQKDIVFAVNTGPIQIGLVAIIILITVTARDKRNKLNRLPCQRQVNLVPRERIGIEITRVLPIGGRGSIVIEPLTQTRHLRITIKCKAMVPERLAL